MRLSSVRPLLAACAAAVTLLTAGAATAAPAAPERPQPRGCLPDPAVLFCEDFDELRPGTGTSRDWGVDTRHGTLTVLPGRHGDRELGVHTEGNGHAFLEVDDFAAPGNSFYGRLRVRVEAFPTAPDWAHFTLVEATGTGDGSVVRPLGGQWVPTVGDGAALWGVGSDGGPTGDWTDWQPSAPAEAGRWLCLEWQQDAADNRVAVWIDGRPQPDLTVTTTDHGGEPVDFVFPAFDTVRVGWQLYQPGPTPASFDLRLDDLALATERLGCRT